MSPLDVQRGDIPLPVPGPISEPYWQGCREGVLRFQTCSDCGAPTHTPSVLCSQCASTNLLWLDSSGEGEIYSWTRVWRPVTPAFVTPYVPIIVTMDEGWWMLANLIHCDDEAVSIGARVRVVFHHAGGDDDIWLPYFELVSHSSEG